MLDGAHLTRHFAKTVSFPPLPLDQKKWRIVTDCVDPLG